MWKRPLLLEWFYMGRSLFRFAVAAALITGTTKWPPTHQRAGPLKSVPDPVRFANGSQIFYLRPTSEPDSELS